MLRDVCPEAHQTSVGWTIRHSTWAGQKIPEECDEILTKAFLRIAYVTKHEDIPSELIANSDQTQVLLQQGCDKTYAPKVRNRSPLSARRRNAPLWFSQR